MTSHQKSDSAKSVSIWETIMPNFTSIRFETTEL